MDPIATQRNQLLSLVHRARNTQFGRDHKYDQISSVHSYQEFVPLRTYEQFWSDYWRGPFPVFDGVTWPGRHQYVATTSGTTSDKEKYIPCSSEMIASNRQAALDILALHAQQTDGFRPLDGKTFMLGGSSDLRPLSPNTHSGDLSGIAAKTMPMWSKPFRFPPTNLALISDWNAKLEALAERAISERIRVLSGNANWVLLLFDKMHEVLVDRNETHATVLPHLQLLIHGGVPYAPYAERLDPLLAQSGAARREVYAASEGFIAIADRSPMDGLRLNLDIGLFFEFVPLSELGASLPVRHWIETIEPNVDYAVALSTCAGLWSYLIGDVVRFSSTSPPRLTITGRTAYTLSAFGEHLVGEEIDNAVRSSCDKFNVQPTEYMVGPIHAHSHNENSYHLYIIEGTCNNPNTKLSLAATIDDALKKKNDSYRRRRENDIAIGVPKIIFVPSGCFAQWMSRRGRLGGQNKVPRVISDADLFKNFCRDLLKK